MGQNFVEVGQLRITAMAETEDDDILELRLAPAETEPGTTLGSLLAVRMRIRRADLGPRTTGDRLEVGYWA